MLISETGSSERHYIECPKCGARGGCAKHGVTASGIDLRARATTGGDAMSGLDAIKAMATRNLRG